jgi:deoxyribodipyrimidine photo-lyase
MMPIQIVWFKRDLRSHDHAPLSAAASAGPICAIFIHEHDVIHGPDFSAQHGAFIRECLDDLNRDLVSRGGFLYERTGGAVDELESLWQATHFERLWSHEESGSDLTYARDRKVSQWCKSRNVHWCQIPQNGVLRGSLRRHPNQMEHLDNYTEADCIAAPTTLMPLPKDILQRLLPPMPSMPSSHAPSVWCGEDKPLRQRGGRQIALSRLTEFMDDRILAYPSAISSPLTAEQGCSRLSPHFAHGTISLREVVQAMNARLARGNVDPIHSGRLINAMKFYAGRLKWRTGYLQNLENRPNLDTVNINQAMNGLRENEFDESLFRAWKAGETGYPMIDAAMAMLSETGWINMRLRGSLISFAVNELWLHWREPMLFLAREFLDYEPAIHWNQAQIHAGTAGSTGLLSYNPVKQARDQDPDGIFVRRWLPALSAVPDQYLFEPWTMPADVEQACGVKIGRDYPAPVVEYKAAGKLARDRVVAAQRGKIQSSPNERSAEDQDRFKRMLIGTKK